MPQEHNLETNGRGSKRVFDDLEASAHDGPAPKRIFSQNTSLERPSPLSFSSRPTIGIRIRQHNRLESKEHASSRSFKYGIRSASNGNRASLLAASFGLEDYDADFSLTSSPVEDAESQLAFDELDRSLETHHKGVTLKLLRHEGSDDTAHAWPRRTRRSSIFARPAWVKSNRDAVSEGGIPNPGWVSRRKTLATGTKGLKVAFRAPQKTGILSGEAAYWRHVLDENADILLTLPYTELRRYIANPSRSPRPSHKWTPKSAGSNAASLGASPGPSPSSHARDVGDEIIFDAIEPFDTRGHFCDLFLGHHRTAGKVALKRLRHRGGGVDDDESLARHFQRETNIWMGLRHERVLQCLGAFEQKGHLYFVSPFMKNGTLFDWIRHGEHIGSDRLRLIHEISEALLYLHSSGIIHGDVKANNVLLSDDLHVQLCDFGLTKLAESSTTTTLKGAGSVRWQSPELWNNEPKTFASDVYAFAMTIVEVLTSQLPFASVIIDTAVIRAVMLGAERPDCTPKTSPDGTSYVYAWDVAKRCWQEDPIARISMAKASELLGVTIERRDPSSPT